MSGIRSALTSSLAGVAETFKSKNSGDGDAAPSLKNVNVIRQMGSLDLDTGNSFKANFLTETVLGSLPKGLTQEERNAVSAITPLSPSLNLLGSLPKGKIGQQSPESVALRRSVLRGSVIVFITAGYSGKRFIFERAKELGVRSLVVDGPDSWAKGMEEEGVIERFLPLDMSDSETVLERALEAILAAKKSLGGDLDGVVSFSEMAQPLVARLAEKLGLPGPLPEVVDAARDKHATRKCMEAAGLPTPRNMLLEKAEDIAKAATHVGFPAVIKPIYGAASIGVVRVDDVDELTAKYTEVCKQLSFARVVDGALLQGNGEEGNASNWIQSTIMMEEYMDGPEVDVDVVMSGGAAVYSAVSDNWPTIEPYFNETGGNAPSILPESQQRDLLDLSVKSVQALGFTSGVFHVECKYTSRGARLIEVNCRMGGGPVYTIHKSVWGVDLVEELLYACTGLPSHPPVADPPLRSIAVALVNATRTGTLTRVDFLDSFKEREGVLAVTVLPAAGSRVVSVSDGMPTWVAELILEAKTPQEVTELAEELVNKVQELIPVS